MKLRALTGEQFVPQTSGHLEKTIEETAGRIISQTAEQTLSPRLEIPEGYVLLSHDYGMHLVSDEEFKDARLSGYIAEGTIDVARVCPSCKSELALDPSHDVCEICNDGRFEEAQKIIDDNPNLVGALRYLLNNPN
jgi:hypothetical protein